MKRHLMQLAALLLIGMTGWAQPPGTDQPNGPRDTLAGHKGLVRALAFSPDGKLLASGSDDGNVKIWDVDAGQAKLTLGPKEQRRSDQAVQAVAFSPDGKSLVYGCMNGTIKVCDVASGKELASITADRNLATVAFVAGGKQIGSGSVGREVVAAVWDIATGKQQKRAAATPEGRTYDLPMAFSPDGGTLAWGGTQPAPNGTLINVVNLLDVNSGKVRDTLNGPSNFSAVAYAPNSQLLIAGDGRGAVRVWDAKSGRQVNALETPGGEIRAVAISRDSRLLAAGYQNSAAVWDMESGKQVLSLTNVNGGSTMSLAFSPDDKILAAGTEMNFTNLWDVPAQPAGQHAAGPNGQAKPASAVREWSGESNETYRVAYSPDGKMIASAGGDGAVRLWDSANGRKLGMLERHADPVSGLAFSPDGATLASMDREGLIVLWDVATQRLRLSFGSNPEQHSRPVGRDLAFLPDGKALASTSDDGIRLWDTSSGKLITNIKGPQAAPMSVACSPDGRLLACGYLREPNLGIQIRIFDLKQGAQIATIRGAARMIFSPDSKFLATDDPGAVQLWDPQTGKLLATLGEHRYQTQCIAFSPDGKLIASGGIDGVAKVWDVASHRELASFAGQGLDVINWLAFSPDGKTLAAARMRTIAVWATPSPQADARPARMAPADRRARVMPAAWNPPAPMRPARQASAPAAADDRPLKFSPEPRPGAQPSPVLKGFEGNISAVAFSRDSKLIATGCDDGTLTIWDVATAQQRGKVKAHSGAIVTIGFSANSKSLMSYGQDQTAHIWDSATGKDVSKSTLPTGAVASIKAACSPDGRTLAVSCMQVENHMPTLDVALWDVPTGKQRLAIKQAPGAQLDTFAFSPDGRLLAAAGSVGGTVKVWDASTGKEVASLNGGSRGISSLVFSADGATLAAMGQSRQATVFDVKSGKEIGKLPEEAVANPEALAISPDHKLVATETSEAITIWYLSAGTRASEIRVISNTPRLAFSPDGKTLAYTTSDRTVVLYPAVTDNHAAPAAVAFREMAVIKDQRQAVHSVAFSHDGRLLATCAGDDMVRIYDVPAFKQQKEMGHQWVGSLAFSPDDRMLASGTTQNAAWNAAIWDVATGRRIARLNAGGEVAISSDGKMLFTSERNIGFWDLATRRQIRSIRHAYPLRYPMSICGNGSLLAWLDHGVVHLTDIATGQDRAQISRQQRADVRVGSFACAPNGTIATAEEDGNRITLWDASGKEGDWFEVYFPNKMGAQIHRMAFSPDGNLLAVCIGNSVKVIDMASHKEVASFGEYFLRAEALAFSPDGRYLAAGVDDGEIHVFETGSR